MTTASIARLGEYQLPALAEVTRCASCGADIIWTRTSTQRAIPLSASTIETRGGQRYALTHFADCEHSRHWRGHGAQVQPKAKAPTADKRQEIVDGDWTYSCDAAGDWRATNGATGARTMLKANYAAAKLDVQTKRFVCACWPWCEHSAPE